MQLLADPVAAPTCFTLVPRREKYSSDFNVVSQERSPEAQSIKLMPAGRQVFQLLVDQETATELEIQRGIQGLTKP